MHVWTQITCIKNKRFIIEHAFKDFFRPVFSGLSSSYTMEPFMPPAEEITEQITKQRNKKMHSNLTKDELQMIIGLRTNRNMKHKKNGT